MHTPSNSAYSAYSSGNLFNRHSYQKLFITHEFNNLHKCIINISLFIKEDCYFSIASSLVIGLISIFFIPFPPSGLFFLLYLSNSFFSPLIFYKEKNLAACICKRDEPGQESGQQVLHYQAYLQ